MVEPLKTPLWTRAVADEAFRQRLIDDPLRALAEEPNIAVSAEQVRQLEEMDVATREELLTEIVREVYVKGAIARFGRIGPDGRFGGGGLGA
jgi:hypothetical protein